jgi:adenylate cyclase
MVRKGFQPVMVRVDDLVRDAWAAIDHGDLFTAYDIAAQPDAAGNPDLSYVKALALARMGDWRGALGVYHGEGLDQRDDVDSLALNARLLKDRAFDGHARDRDALLRQARDAYRTAFDRTGESFAAINAASLSLMAGDAQSAHDLAHALIEGSSNPRADYWNSATIAEALFVLGQFAEGQAALRTAVSLPGATVAARNSTFLQLKRLFAAHGIRDEGRIADLLRPIMPRRAAHFCGMMFDAGDPAEQRLGEAVAEILRSEDVGMAFGALACGADIVIAEQVLAAGAELHVVLPFDRDDFVRESVAVGGAEWLDRYARCIAEATGVHMATTMRFVGDDEQFAFGSRTAMGMTRVRAAQMHAETVQIAVCNDESRKGVAGTAADIASWREAGGRTRTVPAPGARRPSLLAKAPQDATTFERRALRVLVFADFQGFSRIPEGEIPRFWQTVMAGCAEALAPHQDAILAANTWGDGLHLVFDKVETAGPALVALREAMQRLEHADRETAGSV